MCGYSACNFVFRFVFFREPWKRKFLVCRFLEGRIKKRKKQKNKKYIYKIKGGNKRRFYVIISTNLEQNITFSRFSKNNVNAFSALQKFRSISNYTYDHLKTPTSVAISRNITLGQRMKYLNEHTTCSSFNLASMMVIQGI